MTWGPDHPMGRGNFEGEIGEPLQSIETYCGHLCKKAEPIQVQFRFWARMGPRNHLLHGGPEGQFWWIGAPILKYGHFLP